MTLSRRTVEGRDRRWWSRLVALGLQAAILGGRPAAGQDVPEVARTGLEEADRLREAGRADEARARYKEVLKVDPSIAAAYVGLGALEHAAGKPEEALRIFTDGLARAPEDRTLLLNAGVSALQVGKLPDALRFAERALARNPKDVALHGLRGSVLQKMDRPDEALAEFQSIVRLEPTNARAQMSLGNAYFRLGKKTEAIEAFQRAVKEDKTLLAAYYNLGAALFEAQRYDEALKAYEVALAPVEKELAAGRTVDASHARAFLNLGGIYSQRQSWDRALDAYRKAERLEPTAAAAYNIGFILYRMERLDEAYEAYTRAAKLDPGLPLANLHRGLIDERRGKAEQAVKLLEQAIPKLGEADRRSALLAEARAFRSLGANDKARERYEAVLAIRPDEVEALVGLGRLMREGGQLAEARARLEKARKAVLDSSGVALELASLAKAEGDRAQEKALYAEVLKREGDRPEMWPVRLTLAFLLAADGAMPAARQEIEVLVKRLDALKAPEARKLVRTAYAILLAREAERDGALREFQAALKEDRAFVPAQAGIAVLSAAGGNLEAASTGLAALVAGNDFKEVRLLARLNLGKVLWLMGRSEEAKDHLLAGAAAFPEDAAAQAALGEMALAAGDRAGAVRRLGAALDRCETPVTPSAPAKSAAGADAVLRVAVGAEPAAWLCPRVKQALGNALVSAAAETLDRGRQEATLKESRDLAERALGLPLLAPTRAVALFVKGTANLLLDDARGARRDLAGAVAGELPPALVPLARNNLGAALYQDGARDEAQQQFEAARAMKPGLAPAALNLAIALQGREGAQPKALALYDEYLNLGGARREEAQRWAESLRRVYR